MSQVDRPTVKVWAASVAGTLPRTAPLALAFVAVSVPPTASRTSAKVGSIGLVPLS